MNDISKYKIGEYFLEQRLGDGAQASVFKARHEENGLGVALKFFHADKLKSEDRVWNEEQALYTLQGKSPHIIQIIMSYKGKKGRVYHTESGKSKLFKLALVLELAGDTLYDILRDYRPPLGIGLDIFSQIVDAVRVCHKNGICHRDLKLDNIMFDRAHSRVLLVDFGLCSKAEGDLKDIVGSKAFICPEMLRVQKHHGVAADAWALGILLFILVTSSYPWKCALDSRHMLFEKNRDEFWSYPKFSILTDKQKAYLECLLTIEPERRIQNFKSLNVVDLKTQFGVEVRHHDFQASLAEWMSQFQPSPTMPDEESKEQTSLVNDTSRCDRSFSFAMMNADADLSLDEDAKTDDFLAGFDGGSSDANISAGKSPEDRYTVRYQFDGGDRSASKVLSIFTDEMKEACGTGFNMFQEVEGDAEDSCRLTVEEVVAVLDGKRILSTEEAVVMKLTARLDLSPQVLEVVRLGGSRMIFDEIVSKDSLPGFSCQNMSKAALPKALFAR